MKSSEVEPRSGAPATPVAAASVITPNTEPLPPIKELTPKGAQALLALRVILGLFNALAILGIVGLALVMGLVEDGEQLEVGLGVGVWAMLAGLSVGLNVVAYRGIAAGSRAAWILGVFLGASYTLLTCIPLGAVLVLIMVRPEIREHCSTL